MSCLKPPRVIDQVCSLHAARADLEYGTMEESEPAYTKSSFWLLTGVRAAEVNRKPINSGLRSLVMIDSLNTQS